MDQSAARRVTTLHTLLRLGRVSNLPTVWTNCLAGAALATATPKPELVLLGALSMSVVYTGGMFLNDAFDRHHDAKSAPFRPIPAGAIRASTVFALAFLQLALGVLLVAIASANLGSGTDLPALGAAVALVLLVVAYDRFHKENPSSPLLMAGCRALVYVTLGFLTAPDAPRSTLWLGSAVLALYMVGMTWLAKLEGKGLQLRAFGGFATFIAAISLVDAALLASAGQFSWAGLALLGFPATLGLQRWVRGT